MSAEEGARVSLVEIGSVKIEKSHTIPAKIFYVPEMSTVAIQIIQGIEEAYKPVISVRVNAVIGRLTGTNTYVVISPGEERRRIRVAELRGEKLDFESDRELWRYYERPVLLFSGNSLRARLDSLRAENTLRAIAAVLYAKAAILSSIVESRLKAIAGTTAPGYVVRCVDRDDAFVTALKSVLLVSTPKEILREPIPTTIVEAKCSEIEENHHMLLRVHEEYFKLIREEKEIVSEIEEAVNRIVVRRGLQSGGMFTRLEKLLLGIEEEGAGAEAGAAPGVEEGEKHGRIALEG